MKTYEWDYTPPVDNSGKHVHWFCPNCGAENYDVTQKGINLECGSCEESYHPDTILKLPDTEVEEDQPDGNE